MAVSSEADDFLHGGNAVFIAELYEQYLRDPGSVDESWTGFFAELKSNGRADQDPAPAAWGRMRPQVIANGHDAAESLNGAGLAAMDEGDRQTTLDAIRALMLIRAYRVRGHLYARLDPLGLHEPEHHPELDPATYGFGEDDWDRPIFIDGVLGRERASMREIIEALHDIYSSSIGVEFMHIQDPDQKAWIQKRIERPLNRTEFTKRGRRAILERLTEAEVFEHFLDRKYIGTKRFGLEGGEALIPALEQIIKRGGEIGLEEAVVGMAHRGRLNVLANFMGKPFQAIFSEFQGQPANPEDVQGSGDVKYHLGTSSDREFDGNVVHLSLCPNPSHLEIVNPVVIGRARAKQEQRGDHERDKVMTILLHGDAAFIGQGLVAETFE
ncbi:MAG: thiamine pyrophosphate-dependent enzyme, partial [Alphaproteobacteria bacterium]|nr:thiamine pyrophosphate-dependent enzyme [Alphaproteobacteria bacterium]